MLTKNAKTSYHEGVEKKLLKKSRKKSVKRAEPALKPQLSADTAMMTDAEPGITIAVSMPSARTVLMAIGVLMLLAVATAPSVFFYMKYQSIDSALKKARSATADETTFLAQQVGKLTLLPVGEKPTIATVTDVASLKNQLFFAHAKNGDKVLIYAQAKKAILYRPTTAKIIEIAPYEGAVAGTNTKN